MTTGVKRWTYALTNTGKFTPDGYPLEEGGAFLTEDVVEQCVQRHFPDAYFEEQHDGRILIFSSKNAAKDGAAAAVGQVHPFDERR